MANGRKTAPANYFLFFSSISSIFAIRHSLFALSIRYSPLEHSATDQRFHVLDVLPADLVGDRPDAGGARHRVAAEKQMVAGADQAGVEQDRVDVAEFAALDAFREQ